MINAKTVQDQVASASSTSQWRLVWRGFRKRRLGMAGLIVLLLLVLAVIFVPIFFPNPYESGPVADNTLWNAPIGKVDPANGHVFILGSDIFGRDNFSLLFQAGTLDPHGGFDPCRDSAYYRLCYRGACRLLWGQCSTQRSCAPPIF